MSEQEAYIRGWYEGWNKRNLRVEDLEAQVRRLEHALAKPQTAIRR